MIYNNLIKLNTSLHTHVHVALDSMHFPKVAWYLSPNYNRKGPIKALSLDYSQILWS